jgi:hypothetical protein
LVPCREKQSPQNRTKIGGIADPRGHALSRDKPQYSLWRKGVAGKPAMSPMRSDFIGGLWKRGMPLA